LATKQTIDRLCARTDRLATARGIVPKVAVIELPQVMNENAVLERHYRLYPRDRPAELTVTIRRFGGADPDEYREDEDPKISRAWRELARELRGEAIN